MLDLTKMEPGQKVDLTKDNPGLTSVFVGARWDAQKFDGRHPIDVDLVCFPYSNASGTKQARVEDFVFYKQLQVANGAAIHSGDNPDGVDRVFANPLFKPYDNKYDEMIFVDFSKVPTYWTHIAASINIHMGVERGQKFGLVQNATFDVIDPKTQKVLKSFDLGEDWSTQTAVIGVEFYRHGNDWKLYAIGEGFNGGLDALCGYYGIQAEYKNPNQQQAAPTQQPQGSAFPGFGR